LEDQLESERQFKEKQFEEYATKEEMLLAHIKKQLGEIETLKDENAVMYGRGFDGTLAQLQVVHPDLDILVLDPLKVVEDGAIVE